MNFGSREHLEAGGPSLRDIHMLLQGMESRLTKQLDSLLSQSEEHQQNNLISEFKDQLRVTTPVRAMSPEVDQSKEIKPPQTMPKHDIASKSKQPHAQSKKRVKIGFETQQQELEQDLEVVQVSTKEALASDGGQDKADAADRIASGFLPPSIEGHSKSAKPIWERFGVKPSEAAKNFVRDALSNAQKRKIMRSLQLRPINEGDSESPHPLSGIDAVLDVKEDQGAACKFTDTVSGWWKPGSYDNQLLNAAAKRADGMKQAVYDVLMSKGWLAPEPVLSTRRAETPHMSKSERFVSSTCFEMWCCLVILVNAAMLGYTTQYKADPANDGASLSWQFAVQTAFNCWFVFELFIRMFAWRLKFLFSKDWSWNLFDLIVAIISVVEMVLDSSKPEESGGNFAVVRVVRILRLVRALRFIRVFRFFAELRMMIYSSLKSVKPFCWALSILLIIIYVIAIVTTQVVSDYRVDNQDHDLQKMLSFFGSLWESVYTLFMIISGGVSWVEPAAELHKVHWSWTIWMSLYVAFVMFAVLNIVTGIFIESAFKSAQNDQDVVIQEEMNHEDSLAHGFLEVFQRCDSDKSGYIDAEEFDMNLSDHRVRAFLHHLGLDVQEAHGLFRLLDIGGTGRVYAREFVMGCQQLKGPAKNVDVATLLFQNKRMMTLWAAFLCGRSICSSARWS